MKKWLLATLAVVGLTAGLSAAVPAESASAHAVVCYTEASKPYFGRDGLFYGWATFECTPTAPDYQYSLVQLQYYSSSQGKWINYGSPTTSTTPSTYKLLADRIACSSSAPSRLWRTHAFNRGIHGTKDEDTHNSGSVRVYC